MRMLSWEEICVSLGRDANDAIALHSLELRVRPWAKKKLSDLGWEAVEDAVADTCSAAVVDIGGAHGPETFCGFVWGKFLNVKKALLKKGPLLVSLWDVDAPAPDGEGPDPIDVQLMQDCLGGLEFAKAKQHQAVTLHFFSDMAAPQIAQTLGVQVNNAYQLVHKGVKWLRRCMKEKLGGAGWAT